MQYRLVLLRLFSMQDCSCNVATSQILESGRAYFFLSVLLSCQLSPSEHPTPQTILLGATVSLIFILAPRLASSFDSRQDTDAAFVASQFRNCIGIQ